MRSLEFVLLWTAIVGVGIVFAPHLLSRDTSMCKQARSYWTGEVFLDYWNTDSLHFDHPEPNYAILPHVAEFWSCLTTIPFSGALLVYNAIKQDFDIILVFLFLHVFVMYCGAFFSHMTLIAPLFTFTVSAVIANSLHAFFWWSCLLKGPFQIRTLTTTLTLVGLLVGIGAILHVQDMEELAPVGGFYTLVIVQPPFVFLALCAAAYLKFSQPADSGYALLFFGACLLMASMGVSAVETFVTPVLLGNFPLLHVIIHVMEQLGIYMYGTGTAWIHYRYVRGREDVSIATDYFLPYFLLGSRKEAEGGSNSESRSSRVFDLLDKESRVNPGEYNSRIFTQRDTHPCPVLREVNSWAIGAVDEVRDILNDKHSFASNPYPDERLIGLSTTDGQAHTVQRKLAGKFFAKTYLKRHRDNYRQIAETITQRFVDKDGGDLVSEWGYRIAMASGLHAIGLPVESVLNERELDQWVLWSIDMVKLVAPLGGVGPQDGIKLSEFLGFCKNIAKSFLPTMDFIFQVGPSCAWDILRPDLNFQNNAASPRSGMFMNNESIPQVPIYMSHVYQVWESTAVLEPDSFLAVLRTALDENKITKSEGLLLIVQCLVSMTTANALVNSLLEVLDMSKPRRARLGRDSVELESFIQSHLFQTPPLQRLPRRVTADVKLKHSGLVCPAGSQLILMLGIANQGARLSTDEPAELAHRGRKSRSRSRSRVRSVRSRSKLRNHTGTETTEAGHSGNAQSSMTFGWGVHRCLGEELVKLEMEMALQAWINLASDVKTVTPGERIWKVDVGNYGYNSYNVRC